MANRLRIAALGLILAASLAGCVSIETGGPVRFSTVTQSPGGQGQHYMQLIPKSPVDGWDPRQVVEGFLTASASFGYRQIAQEYLTASAAWQWSRSQPSWSAIVYSKGPIVNPPVYLTKGPRKTATETAEVMIGGNVQANLSGTGGYAVPSASHAGGPAPFELVKVGGQWRISKKPSQLLLTSYLFNLDYQPRNLYFFDPTYSYLVPDPAYVPLQATPVDLMTNLVSDLIHQPTDWLSGGATTTAFPYDTRINDNDVTVTGGTAIVNLSIPAARASDYSKPDYSKLRERMSAQLLYTLSGSGQSGSAVQSVELSLNGTPWYPPDTQENPVQELTQAKYWPPQGASNDFYYVDSAGYMVDHDVTRGSTKRIPHLGDGFSQIAVSPGLPGSQYVAALKGGVLYTGPLHGRLTKQHGGYLTMSWDPAGDLWATTTSNEIVEMLAADSPGQPLDQPVNVEVDNSDGTFNGGPFSALRVAPDGVRMAIIVDGSVLNFGAVVPSAPSTRASQTTVKIELSPFYVSQAGSAMFNSVTWYGSDDVITLSQPGSVLTEYPVNGGNSTSIAPQANLQSITASYDSLTHNYALIGGLVNGGLVTDPDLTGPWASVPGSRKGISPVYPG